MPIITNREVRRMTWLRYPFEFLLGSYLTSAIARKGEGNVVSRAKKYLLGILSGNCHYLAWAAALSSSSLVAKMNS